ncbi:MAG: DUF1028 domain-containing protein [Vicinamibacterales bacterium]|nr:DUF1028 domain-containing protein [Vicinamibacterales bacterium]
MQTGRRMEMVEQGAGRVVSGLRAVLVAAFLLAGVAPAWATWSVIAVDQRTGIVVISSATCVAQERFATFPARDLMDIQAIVAPGKAVAAAQAGVDLTRQNQMLIYEELRKGTEPAVIIQMLRSDPNLEVRQFAIVDLQGRSAGFSGAKNGQASLDRQGHVPGTGIYFSVQGNILASEAVVTEAVEAFIAAEGALPDRVMAAMEVADARGGDSRCSCESEPRSAAVACDGKTSHVAYILMAESSNTVGDSYNNGRYTMYVTASNADIQGHENANPVKTLRIRYDQWRASSGWREAAPD